MGERKQAFTQQLQCFVISGFTEKSEAQLKGRHKIYLEMHLCSGWEKTVTRHS